MRLGTILRQPHLDDDDAQRVREARIEAARRNSYWREVVESELVRRGPYLVHSESDEVFTPYRGAVWGTPSSIRPEFMDMQELLFYVSAGGLVVFLEASRQSWSEVVAERSRRKART